VRAALLALALVAGCDHVIPPPDFGSIVPLCPPAPPMSGDACDPIGEPNCVYPMEQIKCTCMQNVFVCGSTATDLGHTD
jgi:hypothetical protein